MKVEKENRWYLFIKVVLSLGIAFLIYSFPFHGLESMTYDARFRISPVSKPTDFIRLVTVDRKTIEALKSEPNLRDTTAVLNNILDEQPSAIVFLNKPTELQGSKSDQYEFSKTTFSNTEILVAYDGFPIRGEEKKLQLPPPFEHLKSLPSILTSDTENFSTDGVTRRAIVYAEGNFFLHPYIAQKYNTITKPDDYRGVFDFRGTKQILVDHKPPNTFNKTSFYDVMEDRFPKGEFKNKIVLIGKDTLTETNDYYRSVFSRDIVAISKLEVHANIIDTLIQNKGLKRAPAGFDLLLTCLISILTLFVVFSLKPVIGLMTLSITLLGFILISIISFMGFGYVIGMAHPLVAIFVCYYFFIPYRLIRENRKSWEYQQKNKLLTEVEELKTNFLGMMSHDLKTPLARIQGMADIALADTNYLSVAQKEALKSILKSSEDLTEFISSILDLTRVESQNIKLKLESKDINQLLEQVIHKYEFMAKEKNIKIIKEFETLFSVKIDVDLMRQVFSNLVENAIKYSPEGSSVLISTEEVGSQVVVQIADTGIGIPSDELNNIFMKFYRSNTVKNSPVKGSGLGLYLAKYFVELHKGDIQVESTPRQGSTFTVNIPTV